MNQIKRIVQAFQGKEKSAASVAPGGSLPQITIVQNIGKNVGKAIGTIINLPDPDAERMRKARAVLLERVKTQWIQVDGASRGRQAALQAIETDHNAFVHGAGLLHLHKRFDVDAVDFTSAAKNVVAHLDQTRDGDAIPPERSIYTVFDTPKHTLLILGAPGAGKTVTLLQLAREALQDAEAHADKPVPVILELAAWADEQPPIADWIVDELNTIQYSIPKEITRIWLKNSALLLLFDGLHELADPLRRRCVERLNTFVKDWSGLVVCCRTAEYHNLPARLTLHDAISVELLSDSQIDTYFEAAGNELAGLRSALKEEKELRDLAATPLMLHIMSIAYADVERAQIPTGKQTSSATLLQHLFDVYVARMFRYGGEERKLYADAQTAAWLAWLAKQMEANYRPVFLIEHLQPSWLPAPFWQWVYMLGSRASVGLVAGLVGGIVIGMGLASSEGVAAAFERGIVEGVLGSVLAGVVVGCVDMAWITRLGQNQRLRELPEVWRSAVKIALTTLAIGVVVALVFALIFGAIRFMDVNWSGWMAEGMLVGMLAGLSASLLFAFGPRAARSTLRQDIQTVERVSWSPVRARRGAILAAGVGLVAGAVAGVIAQGTPLVSPLVDRGMTTPSIIGVMTVIGGVVFSMIGVIFGGFAGTFRKVEKVRPNEGLHLSLVNAGWVAVVVGAIFTFAIAVIGAIIGGGDRSSIISYAFYGLFIGVLASMWYGGLFVLQHLVLRLLLWWTGFTPRIGQYARFLDYAAQHIFLYRVGGGYKFVNRYIQEHFATMNHQPPP